VAVDGWGRQMLDAQSLDGLRAGRCTPRSGPRQPTRCSFCTASACRPVTIRRYPAAKGCGRRRQTTTPGSTSQDHPRTGDLYHGHDGPARLDVRRRRGRPCRALGRVAARPADERRRLEPRGPALRCAARVVPHHRGRPEAMLEHRMCGGSISTEAVEVRDGSSSCVTVRSGRTGLASPALPRSGSSRSHLSGTTTSSVASSTFASVRRRTSSCRKQST
jgi:hypothetical protein